MAWRVIAEATYTSTPSRDGVASNMQNSADSVNGAVPTAGRYAAGVVNVGSFQVTASYNCQDETQARSLASQWFTNITATNRTNRIVALWDLDPVV